MSGKYAHAAAGVSHLTCPAGHRVARPSLSPWRCSPASRRSPRRPATAP